MVAIAMTLLGAGSGYNNYDSSNNNNNLLFI